ncbi:MAG: class I SAM-dependent methyltransferase [Phycisphaerales bacterium]
MLEIATMDTWWELSGRYPSFRAQSHTLLKDFGYMRLLDAFDTIQPKRLLEFGHGFNPTLLAHAQERCEAFGVDDHQGLPYFPPRDEWERMHREYMVAPCPGVRFARGLLGVHELPELEPESFDMIASVSVLEEISLADMRPLLEHCKRLLAPGGVFVGSFDIMLKHPQNIMRFMELCAEIGLGAIGPVPERFEPDYGSMLIESPSVVMLTYQMAEGELRRFNGHWTSAYFCTQRAA